MKVLAILLLVVMLGAPTFSMVSASITQSPVASLVMFNETFDKMLQYGSAFFQWGTNQIIAGIEWAGDHVVGPAVSYVYNGVQSCGSCGKP